MNYRFHTCAVDSFECGRTFGTCTWPYFNLFYLCAGEIDFYLPDYGRLVLTGPAVILFYPRMPYRGEVRSLETVHSVNRFEILQPDSFFTQEAQCLVFDEFPTDLANEIDLLTHLPGELDSDDTATLRQSLLTVVLMRLKSYPYTCHRLPPSPHLETFLTLEKTLRENMAGDIDLDQMAAVMGLSTSYFKRVFKFYADCSPGRFLNNMRIIEAASLVRGTDLPYDEIAARVGYRDKTAFYRAFKKYMGKTPRKHRLGVSGL